MHMHKYVEDKLISDFQTFDGEIPIRDGHFIIVIGAWSESHETGLSSWTCFDEQYLHIEYAYSSYAYL